MAKAVKKDKKVFWNQLFFKQNCSYSRWKLRDKIKNVEQTETRKLGRKERKERWWDVKSKKHQFLAPCCFPKCEASLLQKNKDLLFVFLFSPSNGLNSIDQEICITVFQHNKLFVNSPFQNVISPFLELFKKIHI